jgi:hypothetical protein
MQFDDSRAESKPVGWQGEADAQRTQVRCHFRLSKPLRSEVESSSFREILDPEFRLRSFAAFGERLSRKHRSDACS